MKKVILFLLVAMLFVVGCATAKDGVENNINKPSEWAESYASKAIELGITDGVDALWLEPVNREHFCEFVYNMLDKTGVEWTGTIENPFGDTDNEKVIALYGKGIIEGKSDDTFVPEDELTREEAATILCRIVRYMNLPSTEMYYVFDDESEISEWAMDSVQVICNLGVMNGIGTNRFSPKGNYTAEQAVTTLVRLFDIIPGEENTNLSFADSLNGEMPDDANYMFSPLSIKMALALAANGAEGETQQEILDTIGITDLDQYNESVKSMIKSYSESDLLKIDISNSIWINSDNTPQKFSKEYSNKVTEYFNAESDTVTNKTALPRINGWVNDKTHGKIPTIIGEDNIDFGAMLINAVYFNGRWQNEFYKGVTEKDVFIDKNGKKTDIEFMNKTSDMRYANTNDVQIIELPYMVDEKSEDMYISMYLMMSDAEFEPEAVLNSAELSSTYVALSLPKFKVEYSTGLNDILKKNGIQKAFSSRAEFGNMFDGGNMFISDTLHKTYIEVDEEGTEAAAVTAVTMKATSAMPTPKPEPIEVKFNKPFTFVIRDNSNGEILFMGEYSYAK
ncbi:MAG: S-layer homology domain-containing protein [Clostridia bacterium]|nr:S-layer homology domain-containing protein [Clostridia bacterium]